MIDIQIPASLEYNTAKAKLLATALKNLHSFDEITEWNKKAMAEVEALHSILRAIEEKQQTAIQALAREQQEHKAKPFFTKLFSGRKEQKRWLAEQSRLAREKAQIENVIDQPSPATRKRIDLNLVSCTRCHGHIQLCGRRDVLIIAGRSRLANQIKLGDVRSSINADGAAVPLCIGLDVKHSVARSRPAPP